MRRAFGVVLSTVVAVLALAGFAVPASAAAGDEVRNFAIEYTVTTDGVLHVKETIAYTFGSSGRHGIFRDLITREPYRDDDSKDQLYQVSKISVSSPNAPDQFTTETSSKNKGRDETLRIKIGDPNQTIPGYDATYVISYDVRGALRHFADHSELYWDATGNGWDAVINQVTVNVQVPQGVQQVDCFAGPAGSTQTCAEKSVSGDEGVFGESGIQPGSQLTIVAGIKAGAVTNDAPILADPPTWLERSGISWPSLAGAAVVSVLAIAAAVLYSRFGGKDQRFAGMPPGTFPPDGLAVRTVKNDLRDDQIPVVFAPPKIPVAEGGLLIDAKATTTETAATLIELAVRGGVRIEKTKDREFAVLVNPAAATAPHEQVLLRELFPSMQPGDSVALERGEVGDHRMRGAHDLMIRALRDQVKQREWYVRMPRAGGGSVFKNGFGCACTAIIAIWVFGAGIFGTIAGAATGGFGRAVVIAVPVIAVIVAIGIWIRKRAKGERSPAGRAVADQLIGFRKYLATAEADQLRFEEGEDIFSKYLPWAIVFGLADRWQKVCEQLVAAGRLTPDPYWYSGPSYYTSGWTAGAMSSTLDSTFSPPPAPAGSGGGGGSSSGFSGGSSGGGGGGGGGGSW